MSWTPHPSEVLALARGTAASFGFKFLKFLLHSIQLAPAFRLGLTRKD